MSRIGRAPVEPPNGVNVELSDRSIKVTGPRGELTVPLGRGVRVQQEDGNLVVQRNSDAPPDRAMHGLTRSLLQNAVTGVTDGFTRRRNLAGVGGGARPAGGGTRGLPPSLLQNAVTGVTDGFTRTLNIAGVGYRAALQGRDINLQVGYSHPVAVAPREGIEFEVPNATTIIVRGNDKQQVGQMAAEIRKVRPPEPYKGKGIRYSDEQVRRKVGKAG